VSAAEDLAIDFSPRPELERLLRRCTELLGCDADSIFRAGQRGARKSQPHSFGIIPGESRRRSATVGGAPSHAADRTQASRTAVGTAGAANPRPGVTARPTCA
jgi:hypothetical protein